MGAMDPCTYYMANQGGAGAGPNNIANIALQIAHVDVCSAPSLSNLVNLSSASRFSSNSVINTTRTMLQNFGQVLF